jgi:transposase
MSGPKTPTPALDFPIEQIEAILERAKVGAINAEEYAQLKAVIQTFALLKEELQSQKTSIQRLKRMMFGASTERTRDVLGADPAAHQAMDAVVPDTPGQQEIGSNTGERHEGHGRNAAAAYMGAHKVQIPHPTLQRADACPGCVGGKVYPMKDPSVRVRFSGVAPLQAKVYECARLRCGLCGQTYTAAAPEGVGEQKYDETVPAVIGLLRYGVGLPFHRIEKLQAHFGIPLASSTQWELVQPAAATYSPVHEKMQDYAAAAEIVFNDDTTMKVLELTAQQRAAALGEEAAKKRTGVFTSGIVSVGEGHRIALFFTGVRHAGENLTEVLKRRPQNLPPPIQMCDGLDHNLPKEFETLLCRCLTHSRRKYVEVAASFPAEVRFVLNTLKEIYKIDARARKEGLSPRERLKLHQDESEPLMQALQSWMQEQFAQHKVEPNSGLGEAISYMQRNWLGRTRFLHGENAPLDNNITERALKQAIKHRKNSLFYKTLNGARVGDTFMSLIHTAELNGVDAFEYLVALLRHPVQIAANPGEWMPWNFRAALERSGLGRGPPTVGLGPGP